MQNSKFCIGITVVVVLIIFCPFVQSSVSRNDFLPSSVEAGGSALPPQDDGYAEVHLLYSFRFFNQTFTTVFVDTNGLISFGQGVSTYTPTCNAGTIPLIAAFFGDVDITYGGTVTYLESVTPGYLYLAQEQIRAGLGIGELTLQSVFVVSYIDVPFFGEIDQCNVTNLRNTFQLIIGSDGVRSFAIFNYETIQWTTGTYSGGSCAGTGGSPARAGFDLGIGLGATFKTFGSSCTADIINIASYSNVGIPGKFIFELGDSFQTTPCQGFHQTALTPMRPTFVPVWGHLPVTFKGPCTANISSVTCTFYHYQNFEPITYPALVTSDDTISCIVPYLDTISITSAPGIEIHRTDSTTEIYFGLVYPIEPTVIDVPVTVTGGASVVHAQFHWIPQKFGNSSVTLDLVLLAFENQKWTEVGLAVAAISNTGSYNGDISIGDVNVNLTYAFRLTLNPLGVLNPTELTVPTHTPSLFSELVYLGSPDRATNIQLCLDWYNSDPGSPDDLEPCPPYLSMASVDERFVQSRPEEVNTVNPGADYCFRQRIYSPSFGGETCCYKNGQIIISNYMAGSRCPVAQFSPFGFPDYFDKCLKPKLICCGYTVDAQGFPDPVSCKYYYIRRPSDTGANYTPPASASSGGDPHLVTFDGFAYIFNGYGEYILIQSPNLKMQGRMSPYIFPNGTQALATIFKAFVICQEASGANNRTCIQISVNPPNGVFIYIDGRIIDQTSDQFPVIFTANGMSLTIESATRLTISFSSGFSFIITTGDSNRMLNLIAQAPVALYGQVDGLLGHFDGTQSNDLRTSSGATIPINSTRQTIHYQFGETWRVNATTTLFTYPNGFTWANFQNTNYVPIFTNPTATPPQEIIDMCAGNQNCLYDYGVTGNAVLANDTKKLDDEFNSARSILAQPIVMCPALTPPDHGDVAVNNYLLGSTANYTCDPGYHRCGASTRTCQKIGSNPPKWSFKKPCCTDSLLCLNWFNLGCLPLLKPLGLLACCACD